MPNKFIFADEAGCFTFNREPNVSRYFILCTVVMDQCAVAYDLLELRRRLAWDGEVLGDFFHAATDRQAVRDEVFRIILRHQFSVQATILEKAKARENLRRTKSDFYRLGFHAHFKYALRNELPDNSELLVTTASIGSRKERASFEQAVAKVLGKTRAAGSWKTDFMPAHADPCLQVADYCAWAIQRRWERADTRSYDLIRDRISYERDIWGAAPVFYY